MCRWQANTCVSMLRPVSVSKRNPESLARRLLRRIVSADIDFFVVGGVAARAHGLDHPVNDLDIVYARSYENCKRLAQTLAPLNPHPRGGDSNDVVWNTSVIRSGYSFIMATDLGDIDLIAELTGGGTWRHLRNKTITLKPLGITCDVLKIQPLAHHLIKSGRPKDVRLAKNLQKILNKA